MAIVPLNLPPGLERNNTPYDTPGRWWDMNLVRWQSGSVRPVKGWQRITQTPFSTAVRKIFVYRDNENEKHVLIGTEDKLIAEFDGFSDVTPSGLVPLSTIGTAGGYGTFDYGNETYGDGRSSPSAVFAPYSYWSFSNWGEDVILTANTDGRLFYYATETPTVAPTVISGAPTGVRSVVVTDQRHVMAIGYSDGGTDFGSTVAWSSRENYADWNFISTTNTAGFQTLSTRTPLLKGVKVKEGVLIFSYSDVFLCEYIGLPFVHGFRRVADTALMHPDSIAVFDGKAVWLSRDGFQIYSGGFVQTLECPILDDIQREMDPNYGPARIHASANGVHPEIWFFYASNGSTEADRYVIWNYSENWWGWGSLSRSAMAPADTFRFPYMGSTDGHVFHHESGWTDAGVSRNETVWLETGTVSQTPNGRAMNIRQVLPATGFGHDSLRIKFYSRMTPEGSERVFGPYTPRADGYTDCRVSGRDIRVRFEAKHDGDWGLGTIRFDTSEGTGR